jgi:hypothetical protein
MYCFAIWCLIGIPNALQILAADSHDGSFLILDRVGASDYLIDIRGPSGTVSSAYLMNEKIRKLLQFLSAERSVDYINHVERNVPQIS